MTLYGIQELDQYGDRPEWYDHDRHEDLPVRYGSREEAEAALEAELAPAIERYEQSLVGAEEARLNTEKVRAWAEENGCAEGVIINQRYYGSRDPRRDYMVVQDSDMNRPVGPLLAHYGITL